LTASWCSLANCLTFAHDELNREEEEEVDAAEAVELERLADCGLALVLLTAGVAP